MHKLKSVNDLISASQTTTDNAEGALASELEEEYEPVDEEEDLLAPDGEEGKAALRNASLALSKVVDVDLDEGWKEGAP
jgi:hypothetical protein